MIWSSAVLLGLSAVWGLVWAIRTGQFHGLREGAESIFDDGEPVGTPTDFFPGATPSARNSSGTKIGSMEGEWRR
ncbi:MAG: cbb3-type cytochrome oxidase assembly protein CcoS [Bryobacterales bacterium]|nr:cbb3-type cytochrome oxidase assembly protein CcoS [Bryobacterales bacterium]